MLVLLGIPALTALAQGLNRAIPLAAQEITLTPLPSNTPSPEGNLFLPASRISGQAIQPDVIRSRPVDINFGVLPANNSLTAGNAMDTLTLNLFDDAVFTSQKLQLENSTIQSDGYVWVGNVIGDEYGQAVLAVGGGQMEGFVQTRDAFYQITWSDGGHIANQIDPARFVSLVDDSVIPPERPEATSLAGESIVSAAAANIYIIDLLVVYSDDARLDQGGTPAIQNAITAAVAATNQSYLNSGINQRLRLVHTAEVTYTETNNMNTDLNRVTSSGDGFIDNVHSLRNTYAADMVTFVTNQNSQATGICGLGWLFTPPINTGFAGYAFNIVARDCLPGGRTLAHELGHNMGAAHDVANAGGAGAYSYSYGYRDPEGRFRDIMAYSNGCAYPCPSVNYFSNTTRKLDARPIGTSSANTALTLNNTAPVVAAFRGGGGSVSPTATPGNPNVTVPPTPSPTGVPVCEISVAASDSAGLINAIVTANNTSANTICLTSSVYTFTSGTYSSAYSYGSSALPHLESNITIVGNGASLLRSGAALFRFFYVDFGSLNINNLRMLNGRVSNSNAFLVGGAIFNSATLNVADSYFSDNIATYGGAIYNWGSATIKDTIFTGNSAYYGGAFAAANGISIVNIERSVFQENSATSGSAIYADSYQGSPSNVQVSVDASCFIRNAGTAVDVDEDDPAQNINADGNWWNSSNGPGLDDGSRQAGDVIDAARVDEVPFVTVLPDYCDLPAPFDGSAPQRNYFTTSTPTLTWTRVTSAQSYVIQIADNNAFNNAFTDTVLAAQLPYTVPVPNALSNGFYYWRVAACQAANGTVCGAYSAADSFTVKAS